MDFTKGHGEFELIGIVRDHPLDDVGAEPLVVKFLCWAGGSDILRAEPHLVADIVLRHITSVNIVELGHVIGCLDQCGSCLGSHLGRSGHEIV